MIINLFVITCIRVASVKAVPGEPVPNAEVLARILRANVGNVKISSPDQSLIDFVLGASGSTNNDNFTFNILDVDNVKKIVEIAKTQYSAQRNLRRSPKDSLDHKNRELPEIAFRQMRQSIYSVRYRLESTRLVRYFFKGSKSYYIGILEGSMNQIMLKMDNLFSQMSNFGNKTHLIWYLITYEKMLAGTVDVTYIAKQMYQLYNSKSTRWPLYNFKKDEPSFPVK